MPKKRNIRTQRPDDAFSMGPISFARFGKNLVWKSDWPEGAFNEMQEQRIQHYPKTVEKIDKLISEITSLIGELPPDRLLHRAWWEMTHLHRKVANETSVASDESASVRMIDYV